MCGLLISIRIKCKQLAIIYKTIHLGHGLSPALSPTILLQSCWKSLSFQHVKLVLISISALITPSTSRVFFPDASNSLAGFFFSFQISRHILRDFLTIIAKSLLPPPKSFSHYSNFFHFLKLPLLACPLYYCWFPILGCQLLESRDIYFSQLFSSQCLESC